MRTHLILFLAVLAAFSAAARAQESNAIVRQDSALDAIVPPGARVEKIAGNLGYLEGPVWVRKGGYLIFSDMRANVIYKWNPTGGKVSVFLERSGFTGTDPTGIGPIRGFGNDEYSLTGSNGVTLDPQGKIVFCAWGDRQIVRLEEDGRRTVLASHYESKRLNSPNDLVYRSDGALYFTDPPSGLRGGEKDPRRELPFSGIYLLKGGKLQLLLDDLRPNGLALDPTEKYLYIIDNGSRTIRRYEVQRDGTIANGKVFAPRGAGSIKLDREGNIYYTAGNLRTNDREVVVGNANYTASQLNSRGVWILSPAGKHLGTIPIPQDLSNLAFGDADGKTLFVTGRTEVYRIRLKIPGILP